jgi:hypothetical protein
MKYVRTTTTGHIEADMLGQTLIIAEEMKAKQNTPQRPHRKKMKQSISEMYIRGKLKEAVKWFQTAPTACLRSLKAWQDKKDANVPKYLSGLRRNKRNGK